MRSGPAALHRILRAATLPAHFRRRHGEAMGEVFGEALAAAGSRRKRAALWTRELRDLAVTGWRLRGAWDSMGRSGVDRPLDGRGGETMRGLADDVRNAIRSLVRRPLFSAFAVATVGLGVGATTAIYSTLDGVVLRPVPYADADRMVTLMRPIGQSGGMRTPSDEQVAAWSLRSDLFERVEVSAIRTMTLVGLGDPLPVEAGLIRPSFHEFAGRVPALGRPFTADEVATDARVVLLGHGLWTRRFGGDPSVVGRTLDLDGERWDVVGVMPPRTPVLSFGAREVDLWRPFAPGTSPSPPVAVMNEGVSVEQVQAELAVPMTLADGQEATGAARSLVEGIALRMGDTVRVLMAAVVVLLLIACVNVSNLLLGRAHRRRRETAVRSALGGGRLRLARQLLLEGVVLGVAGGVVGVLLAWLGLDVLLASRPDGLESLDGVALNGQVLAFALAVTLASSVLFSLAPAWQATRDGTQAALRAGARTDGEGVLGARVRWGLVVAEVALSFALVVGSTRVVDALLSLQRQETGLEVDRVAVLEVELPEWRYGAAEEREQVFGDLEDRLAALPGVERVARSLGLPGSAGIAFGEVRVEGRETGSETFVLHGPPVGEGYFAALGQPLLRGRGFTADEVAAGEPVLVIGEGMARRFFDGIDVVGRRLAVGGDDAWHTVVGVTRDVPMTGLSATERPLQIYWTLRPEYGATGTYLVRVAAGVDPSALVASLRAVAREAVPTARVSKAGTLAGHLAGTLARERFTSALLGAFAALALLLAAVGLYGVVSQLVGQRTREFGVRMALGADRVAIGSLVLRLGMGATAVGLLAGGGVAALGLRFLESRLFGLEQGRPATWLVAAAVVAGVTVAATWLPARRATRVDPVAAMRVE